jgi:hypothetical protein
MLAKKDREFFHIDGLVHCEFVPPGQSLLSLFYVRVLQRLLDTVRRKPCDKWQGEWFLQHDNSPSHKSLVLQQFLAEKKYSFNHPTIALAGSL